MKKIGLLLTAILLAGINICGQTPPTIGTPDNDTLMAGSGQNFLLIPDVNDNDEGVDQEITFTVVSSNTDVLEVNGVEYSAGSTFAIVYVSEKGNPGSVSLTVDATDPDGTAGTSFNVYVGPNSNQGINFEIHDVVFWQQAVPLEANPAFSMIAQSGFAPYEEIDLPSLNLSVYSDCQESPPCTGTDFFTALFKGYLFPPVTGDYYFYMAAGDQCSIGLSSDADFDNSQVILYSGPGERIGTSSGDKEWRSVKVSLEQGRTYAIYGTQWNIHTFIGGIMWEGPDIEKAYIPGVYLSFANDVMKPGKVEDLSLEGTGIDDLRLSWSPSTDNSLLTGYNVYMNGILFNEVPITETDFRITGLSPGTRYCVILTAMDAAGNESSVSDIICTTTYGSDETPPDPPTTVAASIISDLAVKLEWSGAVDHETEIRGYNLYVDGILHNPSSYIFEDVLFLHGLFPETAYEITVEAVDAGYNVSEKSAPLVITTLAFDPYDTSITDKKATLNVMNVTIGRSDGLAVNPNYINGEYLDDPRQAELIKELEVAGVRWGALTANPLNFADYIGTGKPMTFGRHMDFCNGIDAYSIITCGVENSTDWMTDPETFINFLEYLAGPPETEYGAFRASEGYTEPLLEKSRGLIFEFGNEVWGGEGLHNAQIGENYEEYGKWCRDMAVLMRASEYYDSTKIFLVYSGRQPVPSDSYGLHELLLTGDRGEVDWLSVGGYLGGNLDYAPEIDPGESEGDYYKNGIFEMARNLNGLDQTEKLIVKKTGGLKPTYMYEANMTKDSYYGRLGQAIVQTDYYASVVERGGAIPTVFHLTGGQWKMTVPAQDYAKTPLFYTTQFYNRFCTGNVLETGLETMAIISNSTGEEMTFDPVGCHAYADSGVFSILLLSRDFENDYTVQLNLPEEIRLVDPANAWMYVISGDHFSGKEATVDSSRVAVSDNMLVTVPGYSMVMIAFEEEEQQVETVPPGYYAYQTASTLSIYPYGSDDYIVDGRKSLVLRTNVEPEDVFWDGAVWDVDARGVEVESGLKSYGFEIKGSGTCDGNGTITVRASAWDNPDLWDEVDVVISGQGTDCGTGRAENLSGQLMIYPNPARGLLYLEGIPEGAGQLFVTDITGRICLSQFCKETGAELILSGLDPGVYYLKITGKQEVVTRPFILE